MDYDRINSSTVLELAKQSIANDEPEELSNWLNLMPIETLDINQSNSLLSTYFDLCTLNNREECMKVVYERWNDTYPPNQKISFYSKLYLIEIIDVNSLAFLAKVMVTHT